MTEDSTLKLKDLHSWWLLKTIYVQAETYMLTVLQNPFFCRNAALGSRRVRFPFSVLNIHMHIQLATEHGHLGLRQQASISISRHLEQKRQAVLLHY